MSSSKIKDTKYTKVSISGEIEEFIPVKKRKKGSLGVPSQYLDLGLYLAAPLLLAVFVGRYLDDKFHKGAFFTISLLIFGTITVFYNLYKLYGSDRSTHQH
ncbi:MAG TPA: AtpZ/AtpI family protein [Candidatus Woesebacteria bacterium]|nr:AtpZ/AtpI family protein [Candidatus Woesebacteria bacterium]